MLTIADSLGFSVVAEGVESTEVAQTLGELGVLRAQGYLWAAPEPPAAFTDRLRGEPSAARPVAGTLTG
jgi:EAL domain-containing protein (putative c-di-GMP-specific phosphodiesterase class I)